LSAPRSTRLTALLLYAVLLVLPTIVLGGLHWHQVKLDHAALLEAVPGDAQDAARRLEEALARRMAELLRRENERPFWEYHESYFPPGTIGAEIALVPSPLAATEHSPEILAWFSHSTSWEELLPSLELLRGSRALDPASAADEGRLRDAAVLLFEDELRESVVERLLRTRNSRNLAVPLPVLAVNLSDEEDVECLRDELPALRGMESRSQTIAVSDFQLRFWVEPDGTPRLAATRNVRVPRARIADKSLPECFRQMGRLNTLRQGFFLDPELVLGSLPRALAAQVLVGTQAWVPAGARAPQGTTTAIPVDPLRAMGFQRLSKAEDGFASGLIAVDTRSLVARFDTQKSRFLLVAGMLALSLATGMALLLRSVSKDLDNARRTENFVAAVTHELRTPVASIKLHGEMLADGWVEDEAKRAEYYRRILKESARLELLVERVLEKGRLQRETATPEPGDLAALVASLEPSLRMLAPEGVDDLRFELEEDLPPAMVTTEGVRSIVSNLVENARKYAPVAAGGEPVLVRVAREGQAALIEVLDRGPGVPEKERERVFEAFYRMGKEQERYTKGTGLGLHLVALHARSMGGRAEVRPRPRGGAAFRVLLPFA
jgi:two-component system phosphate regulon sensor histidine kinase PhoR